MRTIEQDVVYIIAGTEVEHQSEAEPTKGTQYLALRGEIPGVIHEYVWENWPHYNCTALSLVRFIFIFILPISIQL